MPTSREPSKLREWEAKRRNRLKNGYLELGKLLPCYDPSKTLSQIETIQRACSYIEELQKQVKELLSPNRNDNKTEREEIQKLCERIKKLLTRNEQLSNLLQDAGIKIPTECGTVVEFKSKKWSNKISPERAKILAKNESQKENEPKKFKKRKAAIDKSPPKTKKQKLLSAGSKSNTKKNFKKVMLNNGKTNKKTAVISLPSNQQCYIINNVVAPKTSTSTTVVSVASVLPATPLLTANVKPTSTVTIAKQSNMGALGAGTLIFPNGNIVPVLPQSALIQNSTIITATPTNPNTNPLLQNPTHPIIVNQATAGTNPTTLLVMPSTNQNSNNLNLTSTQNLPQNQNILINNQTMANNSSVISTNQNLSFSQNLVLKQNINSANPNMSSSNQNLSSNQSESSVKQTVSSHQNQSSTNQNAQVDQNLSTTSIASNQNISFNKNLTANENISLSNQTPTTQSKILAAASKTTKSLPLDAKINSITSRMFPRLRPKYSNVTKTTQVNKLPIPALTSRYASNTLILKTNSQQTGANTTKGTQNKKAACGQVKIISQKQIANKVVTKTGKDNETVTKEFQKSAMPADTETDTRENTNINKENTKVQESRCQQITNELINGNSAKQRDATDKKASQSMSYSIDSLCQEKGKETELDKKKQKETDISEDSQIPLKQNNSIIPENSGKLNTAITKNNMLEQNNEDPVKGTNNSESTENNSKINRDKIENSGKKEIKAVNKAKLDNKSKPQEEKAGVQEDNKSKISKDEKSKVFDVHNDRSEVHKSKCPEEKAPTLTNLSIEIRSSQDDLEHSELSNDIFASLQVPTGGQNPESTSPTAAFLLAFPLVTSLTGVKVTEVMEEETSDSRHDTPTLLQIGTIDNTKPVQSESLTPSLLNLDNFSFFNSANFYTSFDSVAATTAGSTESSTTMINSGIRELDTNSKNEPNKSDKETVKSKLGNEQLCMQEVRDVKLLPSNSHAKIENKSSAPQPGVPTTTTQSTSSSISLSRSSNISLFPQSSTGNNSQIHPNININANNALNRNSFPYGQSSFNIMSSISQTPTSLSQSSAIISHSANPVASISRPLNAQDCVSRVSSVQMSLAPVSISQASIPQTTMAHTSAALAPAANTSLIPSSMTRVSNSQNSISQSSIAHTSLSHTSLTLASLTHSSSAQAALPHVSAIQASAPQASISQISLAQISIAHASIAQASLSQTSASNNSTVPSLNKCYPIPHLKSNKATEKLPSCSRYNNAMNKNYSNSEQYNTFNPFTDVTKPTSVYSYSADSKHYNEPTYTHATYNYGYNQLDNNAFDTNYLMTTKNINKTALDNNSQQNQQYCSMGFDNSTNFVDYSNVKLPDELNTNFYNSGHSQTITMNTSNSTGMNSSNSSNNTSNNKANKYIVANTQPDATKSGNGGTKTNQPRQPVNWMTTPDVKLHHSNHTSGDILVPPYMTPKDMDFTPYPSNSFASSNSQTYLYNTSSTIYPSNDLHNAFTVEPSRKALDTFVAPIQPNSYQRDHEQENQFSWSPTKLPQLLEPQHTFVPSTLPTLVGDLALGNPPLFTEHKHETKTNRQKDRRGKAQNNYDSTQSNFLSVSQLVDHTKPEPPAPSRITNRRPSGNRSSKPQTSHKTSSSKRHVQKSDKEIISNSNQQNYNSSGSISQNKPTQMKQQQINVSNSYSAEALIGHQHLPDEPKTRNTNNQNYQINNKSLNVAPFFSDNIIPYFPTVDIQQDSNAFVHQQTQNYQTSSFSHNLPSSIQSNSYSTASLIPTPTITTNYLPSTNFIPDIPTHDFNPIIPENLNLFPHANPRSDSKTFHKQVQSNAKQSATNSSASNIVNRPQDDKRIIATTCNSNTTTSYSKKSSSSTIKRKSANETNLPNFVDFSGFLSMPSAINSPILPDDFHAHTNFLPPPTPTQLYPCKNPLYSKDTNDLAAPLLPIPPVSRTNIQHPEISPSMNNSGTSLTNFNLSTIFPEINKGAMVHGDVYPHASRIKDYNLQRNYLPNTTQPPFNTKSSYSSTYINTITTTQSFSG